MKTDQEKIEVMQAHLAGKKIESRFIKNDSRWGFQTNPSWNWTDLDYRIAREPRTIWVNEYPSWLLSHPYPSERQADLRASPLRIRCVKFVEVMEGEQ